MPEPSAESSTQAVDTRPTRRSFLQATGLSLAASVVPSAVLGLDGQTPPSERITLGVIGYGPRCRYVLQGFLKHDDCRIATVCDLQRDRAEEGRQAVDLHAKSTGGTADCRTTQRHEDLLGDDSLDGLIIATGDRWHAPLSILAAAAGKDVYSEKPCGLTIELCQQVADAVNRHGRVYQAGTQRRSVGNFRAAVQIARDGHLGPLTTLHASAYTPELKNDWLPGQPLPDPAACDWNRWLGPAPWRPFNQQYVDGRWRGYWDFDSGARLLDWAAHTLDLCQMAAGRDGSMPTTYQPHDDRIVCRYDDGVAIEIDFLATPFGDRDPHYITRLGVCPVRFEGEAGWIETGDSGEIATSGPAVDAHLPAASDRDAMKKVWGQDVGSHARDFLDCMRSREQPHANHEVMRKSHIACHAAAIAWILGREVTIDPATETLGDADAQRLATRAARDWA